MYTGKGFPINTVHTRAKFLYLRIVSYRGPFGKKMISDGLKKTKGMKVVVVIFLLEQSGYEKKAKSSFLKKTPKLSVYWLGVPCE